MTPRVNDIVQLHILDHADMEPSEIDHIVEFQVIGRIVGESAVDYKVAWWFNIDNSIDSNSEYVSIVKGAIVKARVLYRGKK